jgi:hypothetical protein
MLKPATVEVVDIHPDPEILYFHAFDRHAVKSSLFRIGLKGRKDESGRPVRAQEVRCSLPALRCRMEVRTWPTLQPQGS